MVEVAQTLDTTAASVNSAMQRARQTIAERLPDRSQQATLRSLGDDGARQLVERHIAAWERRDVDSMVADDVVFAMPPFPNWFRSRDDVITFIAATGRPPLRAVVTHASAQSAIAWYLGDGERYRPATLEVLTLAGDRVQQITAFASPELFARFGLQEILN